MSGQVLAQAAQEITSTTTGESAAFWLLAPIAVLSALGMVFVRRAVHGALLLVVNLFCVAVFYMVQDAPFLGFVQIIVYAGAIMVLFLFVLMLVGVDSADSLVETIRGQRLASIVLGLGFAGLLVFPLGAVIDGATAAGLDAANTGGNVQAIARLLFTKYVFAFEAISALLVVAAVGAMILGHRELAGGKLTQKEMMKRRFAEGRQLTPIPGPGVYARSGGAVQSRESQASREPGQADPSPGLPDPPPGGADSLGSVAGDNGSLPVAAGKGHGR
jgi:NADH-quinone oxidoreductase subunit J